MGRFVSTVVNATIHTVDFGATHSRVAMTFYKLKK